MARLIPSAIGPLAASTLLVTLFSHLLHHSSARDYSSLDAETPLLHRDCTTFDPSSPPFPRAVCRNITKSDGVLSVILLNSFREDPEKVSYHRSGVLSSAVYEPRSASSSATLSVASAPPTKWIPGRGDDQSFCDVERTTYSAKTHGPGSAHVVDCLAVQQWAHANAGNWIVSEADMAAGANDNDNNTNDGSDSDAATPRWTTLALVDTCVMTVKTRDDADTRKARIHGGGEWAVAMGNADVRDLVWESVAKAQSAGRIQVLGNTRCVSWTSDRSGHEDVPVDWWLTGSELVLGGRDDDGEDRGGNGGQVESYYQQ